MPNFTYDHRGRLAPRNRKIMHTFAHEINETRVPGAPIVYACDAFLDVEYDEFYCSRIRGHCGEHVAWGHAWDEWYDEDIDEYYAEESPYIAFAWTNLPGEEDEDEDDEDY